RHGAAFAQRPARHLNLTCAHQVSGRINSYRSMRSLRLLALSIALSVAAATPLLAQRGITTPLAQFGHNVGDDYFLANYTQMLDYWRKLDRESVRLRLVRIGTTAEGRPLVLAIITSPENQRKLARYQDISRRLALAEGL